MSAANMIRILYASHSLVLVRLYPSLFRGNGAALLLLGELDICCFLEVLHSLLIW